MITPPPISVIILCQGQQRRLPELKSPKQLLTLPGTAGASLPADLREDVSIVGRTLFQLACLLADEHQHASHVTIVGEEEPFYFLNAWARNRIHRAHSIVLHSNVHELANPGNSSLKGLAEYLRDAGAPFSDDPEHRTVVLLGDVVYSWHALRLCLNRKGTLYDDDASDLGASFCGSQDLSPSTGELWGMQWTNREHPRMMLALHNALQKHPPFAEYQPGQLRRLLYAYDLIINGTAMPPLDMNCYLTTAVYDYTRDIDLPEHVAMLPELARSAIADDYQNGLRW